MNLYLLPNNVSTENVPPGYTGKINNTWMDEYIYLRGKLHNTLGYAIVYSVYTAIEYAHTGLALDSDYYVEDILLCKESKIVIIKL